MQQATVCWGDSDCTLSQIWTPRGRKAARLARIVIMLGSERAGCCESGTLSGSGSLAACWARPLEAFLHLPCLGQNELGDFHHVLAQ